MFFMVLDLRLTKVGTRRSPFFCAHRFQASKKMYCPWVYRVSPKMYRKYVGAVETTAPPNWHLNNKNKPAWNCNSYLCNSCIVFNLDKILTLTNAN